MNWYKRYIGDYQRDTRHLTMVEHGAYALMLDAVYANARPLPADEDRLFRLLGAISAPEKAAVRAVLAEFWEKTDEGWANSRVLRELESANERAQTNKRIAVERETKRRTKRDTNRTTNRLTNGSTKPQPIQIPDTRSQKPEAKDQTPEPEARQESSPDCTALDSSVEAQPAASGRRGTRLPADWIPPTPWLTFARQHGMSDGEIQKQVEMFHDHWVAQTGQRGVKLDWFAVWRNWIRRAPDFRRAGPRKESIQDRLARMKQEGMI